MTTHLVVRKGVIKGGACGHAPLFRPAITFLPSRHRNKVGRFINRRGIIGLVGFAVPHLPIRAPLPISGWPHGRNSGSRKLQKHKNLKNFSNPFGTKKKVVWKGRVGLVDFLPKVRK
jgi:hypothetical protein